MLNMAFTTIERYIEGWNDNPLFYVRNQEGELLARIDFNVTV